MAELHIIGAGLAGLAAAVEASAPPQPWGAIHLYEATARAGGRCRSFFDARLGCVIDNGNHLLLGANRTALAYLDAIGGRSAMHSVAPAAIPFLDLGTGEDWCLRPDGRLPLWLLKAGRGVAGAGVRDAVGALRLLRADEAATVGRRLGPADRTLYRRLWDPLATAILNTEPDRASARSFRAALRALLLGGEAALRPYFAAEGLSAAFVDPALALLQRRGVRVRFGCRARGLDMAAGHVAAIRFAHGAVAVGPADGVIAAVPPEAATALLPDLAVPREASPILNLHYRLPAAAGLRGGLPFLGVIGGTAQWIFARGDLMSVTISAAERLADLPAEILAERVWPEVRRAMDGTAPERPPPCRVIKERRATIAQTPQAMARRPAQTTRFGNLRLAGDWTDTGLPATIEGAVRSGRAAARMLARR